MNNWWDDVLSIKFYSVQSFQTDKNEKQFSFFKCMIYFYCSFFRRTEVSKEVIKVRSLKQVVVQQRAQFFFQSNTHIKLNIIFYDWFLKCVVWFTRILTQGPIVSYCFFLSTSSSSRFKLKERLQFYCWNVSVVIKIAVERIYYWIDNCLK